MVLFIKHPETFVRDTASPWPIVSIDLNKYCVFFCSLAVLQSVFGGVQCQSVESVYPALLGTHTLYTVCTHAGVWVSATVCAFGDQRTDAGVGSLLSFGFQELSSTAWQQTPISILQKKTLFLSYDNRFFHQSCLLSPWFYYNTVTFPCYLQSLNFHGIPLKTKVFWGHNFGRTWQQGRSLLQKNLWRLRYNSVVKIPEWVLKGKVSAQDPKTTFSAT